MKLNGLLRSLFLSQRHSRCRWVDLAGVSFGRRRASFESSRDKLDCQHPLANIKARFIVSV